jgi:hypothetical protein
VAATSAVGLPRIGARGAAGTMTTIGIDFDNTIVSYDDLMYRAAVDRGLLDGGAERSKRAVRDRIRRLPDGEIEWQKLQALAYGPGMRQARLTEGAGEFLVRCRAAGLAVFIVSHKTEYAACDETRTNLRTAALDWMDAHGLFGPEGPGLSRHRVFFESTRAEKIARIRDIGCSHFIDDLEEVLLDPAFPTHVHKLLYAPHGTSVSARAMCVMQSWHSLCNYFFDGCA